MSGRQLLRIIRTHYQTGPHHTFAYASVGYRYQIKWLGDSKGQMLELIQMWTRTTETLPNGTVPDFMRVLFRERSWGDMAESETYAHLEHLRELGELNRSDVDGTARYAPAS